LLLLCLQGFRSLLTDSQDASYLFNAVLDAVVDHTLPLVQVRAPPPRGASKCGVTLLYVSQLPCAEFVHLTTRNAVLDAVLDL
jgi:hypothetical protein